MASGDDFSDLLIFKKRNMVPETTPKKEERQQQQTKYVPITPAQPREFQPSAKPLSQPIPLQLPERPKAAITEKEPQKDAKSLYCINHPWRSAYGYCAKDKLPYCFVDLIEYGGKTYCLNDIDSVLRMEGSEPSKFPPNNNFSILSSILLFANVVIIFYYTRQQTEFIVSLAARQGIASFLLGLNQLYLFPVANIAVIVFGIIAALAILRRSLPLFIFAFMVTFGSIFIMVYQYVSNSVPFALISSVVLLISVSTLIYSRMSAITANVEKYLSGPEIDWPRPEVF